ncbi:helix-turn-helix transcriptional regulator [Crocinitomix algicola]|uniref:helix-turn-helix transcriptional regulator n=1 Tax=Crocinitomix algicola TaxID=1740263 RepID=UPI000872E94D|nr:YafY family protein [Crocinitomix algicola]
MQRLSRLTLILIQLQSKKIIVAKEIAERFEISLRTVYRDINTLQDAGVPIGSENGKGYFLVEGYHLPPIMLNEKEVSTLVSAQKFIQNQGDTSLKKDFDSLLIKIKSTLKTDQKDYFEKLAERIAPSHLKTFYRSNSLSDLKKAILKNLLVEIEYHALHTDEISNRKIQPLGLYFSSSAWILISFCTIKKAYREFRLDRILNYEITNSHFTNRPKFDLTSYFIEKNNRS